MAMELQQLLLLLAAVTVVVLQFSSLQIQI